jgi:hypothetical protein
MAGIGSIPDAALDAGVAGVLLLVLGFRWRLLFSLALELVPFATLMPSWTAVVLSLPTKPPVEATPAPSAATEEKSA